MDLKGGRLSEVLLPREGVRKRLCAWRHRAVDAAAAGDDPAAALPLLPAAEGQEEAGDDDDEAEAKQAEDGAKAVAARPIDWQRDGGEDDELPDFNRWGRGGERGKGGSIVVGE